MSDAIERLELFLSEIKEVEEVIYLGSSASLDRSPKKNWVEVAGGLPRYVREIANALIRDHGFTISHAIATAISRLKVFAATGSPEVKAKAIAALAEWEKLKAKGKVKGLTK